MVNFNAGFQLKYSSKPQTLNRTHSYKITLSRKRPGGKRPYEQSDNDYYVIELGGYHNQFLIIPEGELISMGYITTDESPGKHICLSS